MAPVQVKMLPIGDEQVGYCDDIARKLTNLGVRVEVDRRNETIGYKLRNAQLEKVPYMIVVGAKEVESNTLAVRSRKDGEKGAMSVDQFIAELLLEIAEKRR